MGWHRAALLVVFAVLLWAFAVLLWDPLKERTCGWLRVRARLIWERVLSAKMLTVRKSWQPETYQDPSLLSCQDGRRPARAHPEFSAPTEANSW